MGPDSSMKVGAGYNTSFDRIYKNEMWGRKGGGSGPGSELTSVLPMCIALGRFIDTYQLRKIVDLSCGAMVCGRP